MNEWIEQLIDALEAQVDEIETRTHQGIFKMEREAQAACVLRELSEALKRIRQPVVQVT